MKIDHSQLQDLVAKVPADRLNHAYRLIKSLVDDDDESLQHRMMKLSLEERRKLMGEQANQMAEHYNQTGIGRQMWQSGDFHDEY